MAIDIPTGKYENPVTLLKEALSLKSDGDFLGSISILQEVCRRWPLHDQAQFALAECLVECGRYAAALDILMRMDALSGPVNDSRYLVATLLLKEGSYDSAKQWLDRALICSIQPSESRMLPLPYFTPARLVHDALQLNHLIEAELVSSTFNTELTAIKRLFVKHFDNDFDAWPTVKSEVAAKFDPDDLGLIYRIHRRVVTLQPCETLKSGLNNDLDWNDIVTRFNQSPSLLKHVIVDDFLNVNALLRMQDYLLNSWIWFNDAQKGFGYIGAYQNNGLYTPLIAQIGAELIEAMPQLLRGLKLKQVWAYRNVLGARGVGVHADFASVNINLWITPNHGNLNPASGGLNLFALQRPDELEFEDYNGNESLISETLEGVRPYQIPYRCNRAVIFDSALFHGSDTCEFRNEWDSLRTNLTFLFD